MAENTSIEWCDHTFNPWSGCTKVSPGCTHCYAESLSKRNPKTLGVWGKGRPRKRMSEAYWRQPLRWNADARTALRDGDLDRRPRVFCASLADWLDDEVSIEWLADLLDLIRRTPDLDWLLLTKRPQNWAHRLDEIRCTRNTTVEHAQISAEMIPWWLNGHAPANVWIGTTVEDQTRADERIPLLLSIPAKVRFLSCEPLLGPVNLTRVKRSLRGESYEISSCLEGDDGFGLNAARGSIDWVICGGESGANARPMNPAWPRSLRDQCEAAKVPFFFKQRGEWTWEAGQNDSWFHQDPIHFVSQANGRIVTEDQALADGGAFTGMFRVGKKAAGRLLDGREHNEFPAPSPQPATA